MAALLTASSLMWPSLADAQRNVVGNNRPRELIVPNVVYAYQDGLALTFDVFRPERPIGAAVLSIASGGYGSAWRDPEEARVFYSQLLDAGFVVFSIRHGSAPRYVVPDYVDQLMYAVRHIRYHAPEWGVNPSRLGLFGGSSGGHLALAVALGGDDGDPGASDPVLRASNRVATVVAFAPPSDMREYWGQDLHPAFLFPEEEVERVSPILHVSSDDPPTLLVHGTADLRVPFDESRRLSDALTAVGVSNELVPLEGSPHGFRGDHAVRANEALVRWLTEYLGGGETDAPQ